MLRSRGRKLGAPSASSAAAARHASSAPSERVRRRALACGEYRASSERARRRRIQQGGAGTRGDATAANGTVHAADCLYASQLPEVFDCTVRDIRSFCDAG